MFVAPCFHFVCSGFVFFVFSSCCFCPCLVVFQPNALKGGSNSHEKRICKLFWSLFEIFTSTQLCNPTAGSKVPGFQRCGSVLVCGVGKNDAPLPDPEIETQQSLLLWITVTAVGRCTICIDIEYYNVLYYYIHMYIHAACLHRHISSIEVLIVSRRFFLVLKPIGIVKSLWTTLILDFLIYK